jgi:hypothetical protein
VLDSVSTTSSQREEYRTDKSFLTKKNVKLLSKFIKDGKMKETIINQIQLLTADVPTSFREFEIDYKDQDNPNFDEAYYCLDDGEKNLMEKACCVQLATDYLIRTWENLLNLLAHNTFNECAKFSKQIDLLKFIQENQFRQKQFRRFRSGFKAALRCLESAVYLLLDVLKAHNLRTKDNLANMSVVSSYLSTKTGEVKDQSYYFKNNAFRDLIKAQNKKANKIEALIEIGDLSDEHFHDLGLKGVALPLYNQDRRQVFHDRALSKGYGPKEVRPGGPKRFEKEIRYAASTTTIDTMLPIELYTTYVNRDQESNRLQSSIQIQEQEQLRSKRSTRTKVHSAPFKANSKGHVTGNSVYVQNNGTQRHTRFDDHLDVHEITEAEKTQMEAIDRLKNQNSDGTGKLGRKEPYSSQPDSRRNTLESSDNIHPNMFSSTARDRNLGIGVGFGSAIKTRKRNDTENRTPPR